MKKLPLFLLVNICLLFAEKNAYIITGPESSGSMFITEYIGGLLDCDCIYGDQAGEEMTADTIAVHISQPFIKKNNFMTLNDFKEWLFGYRLHFILTTRDQNIVKRSKLRRFGYRKQYFSADCKTSRAILSEIMETERFVIWNYETMVYLKEPYFKQLHQFLGIESDNIPKNLFDANKKHVRK